MSDIRNIRVPTDVWQSWKVRAKASGTSVTALILGAMESTGACSSRSPLVETPVPASEVRPSVVPAASTGPKNVTLAELRSRQDAAQKAFVKRSEKKA